MNKLNLKKIIHSFRKIENHFSSKFLTVDGEIIFILVNEGEVSSGNLLNKCKASNASFYNSIKKMTEMNLIESVGDSYDRRVTRYKLAIGAEEILRDSFYETEN